MGTKSLEFRGSNSIYQIPSQNNDSLNNNSFNYQNFPKFSNSLYSPRKPNI